MKKLFIITVLTLIVCPASAKKKPAQITEGQQAPKFMLQTLEGQRVSIRDFTGKKLRNPWKNKKKFNVLLSFWATYCVPCKKEIPELEELVEEYPDDVLLLLVSIDKEGKEIIIPYVNKAKFKSAILVDKYQVAAKKYGVDAVPTNFLIDKEGKIQKQIRGYTKNTVIDLRAALQRIAGPKK